MDTTTGDLMKPVTSMAAFGKGSADAIMKSSQIWMTGCQALSQAMTATTQGKLERTMAAWQALSHVKSPKEAMDIQTSFARVAVEEAFAQTTKFVDATTKLAREAMVPLAQSMPHVEQTPAV